MPPGTLHYVYTAENSLCRGGHFLSIHSLHLSELSMAVDHKFGLFATNNFHRGVLRHYWRLVIWLALGCGMLLCHFGSMLKISRESWETPAGCPSSNCVQRGELSLAGGNFTLAGTEEE
jgi:hypothetical protein